MNSPQFFQYVVRRILLLEQESCVDIECTITILLTVLADGLAVLEADDKVLIHDKAQTSTDGDVGTVAVKTFAQIFYSKNKICYKCINNFLKNSKLHILTDKIPY